MKLHILVLVVFLSIASAAWAGTYAPVGDPGSFMESVNWCQLAAVDCGTTTQPTPTAWVSGPSGKTGSVGLFYDESPFTVTNDGSMGLINSYYGAASVTLDDVAMTFDDLTNGAGAYIQSSQTGTLYFSVYLFNDVYNTLTGWTWSVTNNTAGSMLFIGARSSDPEVFGVAFEVLDAGGNLVPFSVGTLEFDYVPEPGSLVLVAPMLLGLGVMLRKRARKS